MGHVLKPDVGGLEGNWMTKKSTSPSLRHLEMSNISITNQLEQGIHGLGQNQHHNVGGFEHVLFFHTCLNGRPN